MTSPESSSGPRMNEANGVIHDIGYQRYAGTRLGRRYAARSLYAHGVRTAFGLGRSAKAKIFPWFVVGVMLFIAVVVIATRSLSNLVLMTYAQFPQNVSLLQVMFCAAVAPELVSRDLRSGVLPLYFSRPLTRSDYPLAKLGAIVTALWLALLAPLLLMFIGGAATLHSPGAVWDEFVDLGKGAVYALLFAVVYGSLSLVIAALAARRAVAAAAVVAVFLITTPVVGVLSSVGSETLNQLAGLASPLTIVGGVGDWLFERSGDIGVGPYGPVYLAVSLALIAACVGLLLFRYRRVAR
jgi:ABC-2 type transport system permease protein